MYGATIGKLGILAKPMTTNQACCACIPLENVNNTFIFYQLLANRGAIIKQAEGAAQPNISKEKILVFSIGVPPFHEQQAIAGALSDIDALISAQEELLAKKRAIKQGAMQELLTGRRRLPGFPIRPMKQTDIGPIPEDWEVKELGEIETLEKGKGISKEQITVLGIPCIRYAEIYTRYAEVTQEIYSHCSETRGLVYANEGDVIFACSGETYEDIGKCVCNGANEKIAVGGDAVIAHIRENNGQYLSYYLNSSVGVEQKMKLATGLTIIHLKLSELEKALVPLPSLSEQAAIAAVLSDMDAEITAVEEELAKHRALKRGMMQELLSGRIRLPYKKSTHKKQNAGE